MKFIVCLVAALTLAAASTAALPAGPPVARRSEVIPDRFIVKLRGADTRAVMRSHLASYKRRAALEGRVEDAESNRISREYSRVLNGFAGTFSAAYLNQLRAQLGSRLEYVVPDMTVHAFGDAGKPARVAQNSPPSWGLTRVSERKLDLAQPYRYLENAGEGVDVFVVDTGIVTSHSDFGGRASMNATFVSGEAETDGNGPGTHCAGTIGSKTYGIAKKVNLLGVKVLSSAGSGTLSGVISGMDHVAKYVRTGKTVMSMSLGGGKNQALNDALNNAVKAGVVAVIAAGNNNGDACQISPAGAELAYTVGATDKTDSKASFSNWGSCVNIHAPGVAITSLWLGPDGKTNTISGTSMATPHVAGVAASIMSEKQYSSPQEVYDALSALATKQVVTGLPAQTVNALLYNGQSDEPGFVGTVPDTPEGPKPADPKPEAPRPEEPKPEEPKPEKH